MSASEVGRSPVTIVELEQPRCTNTFGVSPCTATGTACYNCPGTCGDLANLNNDGSIKWRFTDDRPVSRDRYDFSDPDNLELPPLPTGVNVSTSASQINAGSNLDGRSPLGVTGKVSVGLSDFQWNDIWGDNSLASRSGVVAGKSPPVRGPFWALWTARNQLFNDMYLRIYDGYETESLSEMRQRLYTLDKVDGPNSSGKVTLTGLDPLRLAGDKKSEFPRTSDLDLYGNISLNSLTVQVFGAVVDLSDDFGNTGDTKYLVIDREIIRYTGYTNEGEGVFTLTGILRGALGTDAAAHEDGNKVQRVGRYEALEFWLVANDLLANHTEMPPGFIPLADWNEEGSTYLPTYKATRTILAPTSVKTLLGQITQQGLFYIWWEEYAQEIKMLAVRAPEAAPTVLTDESNLIRGSTLTRDPSIRVTKVAVYYNQTDVFGNDQDATNYANRYTAIDGDNLGETRAISIYAPWIENRTQAVQLSLRLLIRYKSVPKFLSVSIDAKDREVTVGSVVDIETAAIVDSEGNLDRTRWQVISAKELKAGHSYALNLQTYEFVGRFGRYMAADAPDYDNATDAEKAIGSWYSGADGLLSAGEKGYQYQ
tara:strand:+ start:177 stop:1964 length:1788 start_codon:yes stop_codon:yes gene_type:complete